MPDKETRSQVFRAANYVRELDADDIRTLMGIELGMRRYTYVPLEQISFYSRFSRSKTQYHLDKLHKLGVLQRNSSIGYIGYQLIMESYDILALNALVEKNEVVAVGDPIGRGKESDVFFGQIPSGKTVALKFHRIGQTSFRKVRALRSYVQKRRHISWLYVSRLSAEREFEALKKIEPIGLRIPKPIAQNRHVVVMDLVEGVELSLIPKLEDPIKILNEILEQVEILFLEANIIHCDLSEYNILITEKQEPLIIDWPQWEPADHPNALFYLNRDLQNIYNFFHKHYEVGFDVEKFLDKVFGSDRPKIPEFDD